MTKEEAAFLKAIAEQPSDDNRRLVYADWLDEKGGDPSRAELIRLQCHLERGVDWQNPVSAATSERLKELQDREKELIDGMRCPKGGEPGIREFTSTPDIAAIVAAEPKRVTFKRGMIDFIGFAHLWVFQVLSNRGITALPQGLYVGGNLDLHRTPITALPSDLHVGGDLDLHRTPIASLPLGLHVGGKLNLSGTHINATAARDILTMPNLSREAKISGLETLEHVPALVAQARRLPETNTGPGTPPRP